MSSSPSFITAPVLQQLLAALSDKTMRDALVWTLANDPLHWEAVAQAYDAGVEPQLSDHDLQLLAAKGDTNPGVASWAAGVRAKASQSASGERLKRLAGNLKNWLDVLAHISNGALSSQLHPSAGLGLGKTAFSSLPGFAGREPRQVSELALALAQITTKPDDALCETLLNAIDDPLRPIVEFVVSRKPRALCAVDVAAAAPWLMPGLLNRFRSNTAVRMHAVAAVEDRMANMCKASSRSPRTPRQMYDIASVVRALAHEGLLPSKASFAQMITVRTKTEHPPKFGPDEHKTVSFEAAFPFTTKGPVAPASMYDLESTPGSIWAYLAARDDEKSLRCAHEAGLKVDDPKERIRLASAVHGRKSAPLVAAFTVEIGADSFTPEMEAALTNDTRAVLQAARAQKLLQRTPSTALVPAL